MNFKEVKLQAQQWLTPAFDQTTRDQVEQLMKNDEKELFECFYKNLEFGTGGLRGIMGVGTNRMNQYTVGMATQGLCNYLKTHFSTLREIKVAIAYDSRKNSKYFAEIAANVLSANNITVYLFSELRPTPELSFAVRYLHCQSGIVITASHNPKEYNGYKVYWENGGQIIAPHDKNIIAEVQKIKRTSDVNFKAIPTHIKMIGTEIDNAYFQELKKLAFNKNIIAKHQHLKIVYTSLHGTGITLLPTALENLGFTNIILEEKQAIPDGNFPTVVSPNPENREALEMAIEKARQNDADIVLATDPDADRIALAVKSGNDYTLLNGNQTAALLTDYILEQWEKNKRFTGNEFIVKTIVTTDLLKDIANGYQVKSYEVLTGFKYIADVINQLYGKEKFICGGEESYGFLIGDFVRDKDAISTAMLIAEMYAYSKENNQSLINRLENIYKKYGFYYETLINIVKGGSAGATEIAKMMDNFRKNALPPIDNEKLALILDYQNCTKTNISTNNIIKLEGFPTSNVLQFIYESGTKISVRPSGTEPKIKFYISLKMKMDKTLKQMIIKASEKINNIETVIIQ